MTLLISIGLLGYLTAALGLVIALAIATTLTLAAWGLRAVGGNDGSHLGQVVRSLIDVRADTASLPGLLSTLNSDLSRLQRSVDDVEHQLGAVDEPARQRHANRPMA